MSGPTRSPKMPTATPPTRGSDLLLQRKCACGGKPGLDDECATCRHKRLQRKRIMDTPGDRWEREADRVAEAVTRAPSAWRRPGMLSVPVITPVTASSLQRNDSPSTSTLIASQGTPQYADSVASPPGPGQPFDRASRSFFEPRLGHDFSGVRIHNNGQAVEMAEAVGARAFTAGRHIFFGGGEYAPGTFAGRKLIAHELVHTIQQESVTDRPRMLLQRAPKEKCGAHFLFEFDAVINDKPLVRGVPRVYYSQYPTKTDPAGQRVEPIVSQTNLPAGQRSSDGFWRAVCHEPKGAPPQILWVLNDYVSRAKRPKEERKEEERKEEERKPEAAPEGKNLLEDCSPDQKTAIQKTVSGALANLDGAISALSARPLSEHARHALFLAFRASDDATAESVVSKLRAIRNGLPTVGIECEQSEDVYFCSEGTAAYTNLISGVIHLCMKDWDESDPVKENPRTLIHEGAHAFAGAPSADDPYFDHTCDETSETSSLSSNYRLGKADPLACVVYHLRHRTAESAKFQKELYSGESLKRIIQSRPTGPISLSAPSKKPFFLIDKAPVEGGFTYRWRLYDDADRHYLLRGEESNEPLDWLAFTNQGQAIVGKKTRDLLAERGVRKGRIECTIRLPDGTEKTLSLGIEFTP